MAKGDRSTRYVPGYPSSNSDDGWYTYNQLRQVSDWALQPVVSELGFDELHEEPPKPFVGLVVYADGTDWNPGSGEGLYVYKSGGWTLIA